jgi:hypothetical protein
VLGGCNKDGGYVTYPREHIAVSIFARPPKETRVRRHMQNDGWPALWMGA